MESGNSTRLATHVGDFSHILHAIGEQHLGILFSKLVLESARHSDVALHAPSLLARGKDGLARELVGHVLNLVTVRGTHVKHVVNHLSVDTFGQFAHTVGTADGDHLGTEFASLLGSTPSHVTEAREGHAFAFESVTLLFHHVLHIVDSAETSGLGTHEGTTPAIALASQSTSRVLTGQLLVHTVHVANLTATNTNVTSRAVLVRTNVAPQFVDESLAETHDFSVALSCRIEVGTTLTTAERQVGQAVLEDLFEAQELQH